MTKILTIIAVILINITAILVATCAIPNKEKIQMDKDVILTKIKSSFSDKWEMFEKNGQLIIENNDFVWILFENQINAPLNMEKEQEKIERIKKFGKKTRAQFTFSYENKWSKEKIQKTKNENDLIYKNINALAAKYNISHLYNESLSRKGEDFYIPTNQEEEKRIQEYQKEKSKLEGTLQKLPDYHTEKYSLFLISKVGCSDEFHIVYPEKISREMYIIENLISELCEK